MTAKQKQLLLAYLGLYEGAPDGIWGRLSKVTDYSRTCYIGVNNTLPKDRYWNTEGFSNYSDCEAISTIKENGTVTVDISELTGLFYIWIGERGQDVEIPTGCNITEVWLSN